jgi:hypothetical protein
MDKRRQDLWFGLGMLLLCLTLPLAFWMWSEFFCRTTSCEVAADRKLQRSGDQTASDRGSL